MKDVNENESWHSSYFVSVDLPDHKQLWLTE